MKLPLVPDKIEGWNIRRLNELLKIVNVESDTLEFKGRDFHSLTHVLCAMANLSGGYVVLGIEQDKPNNRFTKNGFDKEQEENIRHRIAEDMYNVKTFIFKELPEGVSGHVVTTVSLPCLFFFKAPYSCYVNV